MQQIIHFLTKFKNKTYNNGLTSVHCPEEELERHQRQDIEPEIKSRAVKVAIFEFENQWEHRTVCTKSASEKAYPSEPEEEGKAGIQGRIGIKDQSSIGSPHQDRLQFK